ncbi:MAG TPA: serine/threonine-protein kinase [Longimicrobiaceae bacterium]|nr:serine/threonine-protein kinase [Longimicrobiaceae bacterium]
MEAVIGRGGMGAVYRALDERLGRRVAVKVISVVAADQAEQTQLRARFVREAQVAARLRHPNVVDVFDFGTDPELGMDYLVMELLDGEDLSARMARGTPPRRVALAILRQAARGLAAGHRAGLVHRDVKPGNLFLEVGEVPDEPVVRVLDFGIAQVTAEDAGFTRLTEYGRSPYSPAYAAPEQLLGETRLTASCDVFSLAAVGYVLLTGMRAFTSSDPGRMASELSAAVLALEERAPGLPAPLRGALARALARRPQDRFPDAGAFANALSGTPGPSPSPSPASSGDAWFNPASAGAQYDGTMLAPNGVEHTQLYEAPAPAPAPAPRAAPAQPAWTARPTSAPARPQADGTAYQPYVPPFQRAPVPAAPVAPVGAAGAATQNRPAVVQPPQQPPARGMMRRVGGVLADLAITVGIMGGFVGAWALAVSGVLHHDQMRRWLGASASVFFTPLAIHRLTGRTGRPVLLVIGSAVGSGVALHYLGPGTEPMVRLGGIFGMQVVTSFVLSTVFPRPKPKIKLPV